ncbi:MAG: response regulator transcription factor [Leptospiraceae bacterium]|nr:response regulator transcription factor [Leptospiraceae bacterium]MCP5502089.1 response regulator transcription factor [Leptospiraceae bacterium]
MRILIIDDEPPAARRIAGYCEEVFGKEIQTLKTFHALFPAIYYLEDNPVDLVFLDIDLNEENGFDLLRQIPNPSFYTIITSSHTEYAIDAFEFSVLDFLPKPFPLERFAKAMVRVRNAVKTRGIKKDFIPVKKEESLEMVKPETIAYLESDKNYTLIYLKNSASERVRKTMDKISEDLPPNFIRIHRSCIVNLEEVERILYGKNNTFQVQLKNNTRLPLSRSMFSQFKKAFEA